MKYVEEKKLTKILYIEREVTMPIERAKCAHGFISYKNGVALFQDEYYDMISWLSVVAQKTFSYGFGIKTKGDDNDTIYNSPNMRISNWMGDITFFERELVRILNYHFNTSDFYYKITVAKNENAIHVDQSMNYMDDIKYIADRYHILSIPKSGDLHHFVEFLIDNEMPFCYNYLKQ